MAEDVGREDRVLAVALGAQAPAKWNGHCARISSASSSSVSTVFSRSQDSTIARPSSPRAASEASTSASNASLESVPPEIT